MQYDPQFKFFLSDYKTEVKKGSKIWNAPLPLNRKSFNNQSLKKTCNYFTYGDYFSAAKSFLEKNRFEAIRFAASKSLKIETGPEDVKRICIFLEKHGAFYHPARLETAVCGLKLNLVLNCAVLAPGGQCIRREYKALQKLSKDFPFTFLPKVYCIGKVTLDACNKTIMMFLGEWLEDFREFHLSWDHQSQKNRISVWDKHIGNYFLSNNETLELYTQASMILTCYYNLESFEQIFPWHHAAGDFVIKYIDDNLTLKLVTARQYASMLEKGTDIDDINNPDTETILYALFIFLLNLSIRMRIDRLDGIGDIVWSDKIAVQGAIKGFFKGLSLKPVCRVFGKPVDKCFVSYLKVCTKEDLYDLLISIVNTYNPNSQDLDIIKKNIKEHTDTLYHAIVLYCSSIM